MKKSPIILTATGLLLIVATVVVGWLIIPEAIKTAIETRLHLSNGTRVWKRWLEPTEKTEIFIKFYIFNTTNPHQVKKGEPPILQQFGPYVYTEKRIKTEVTIHPKNGTVAYRPITHYFFRPDLSIGNQSDVFTILNAPNLIMTSLAARRSALEQQIYQMAIQAPHAANEDLFVVRSVDQILCGGWHVPMSQTLENTVGKGAFQNHTFGFWYPKNESFESSPFEIKSGGRGGNWRQFGKIVKWRGSPELKFWTPNSICNQINGSDGSIFPPSVSRKKPLQVFISSICRSFDLTYGGETEVNGVTGYQFNLLPNALQDPRTNGLDCFCYNLTGGYDGKCYKSGVHSIAACRSGAPIAMSCPHFLYADPEFLNMVHQGLNPKVEEHRTYIVLEPNTGVILRVHRRLQINVQLTPNNLSELYTKVPDMVYPILWFDETSTFGKDTDHQLRSKVLDPLCILKIARWSLLGLSTLLAVLGVGWGMRIFFSET